MCNIYSSGLEGGANYNHQIPLERYALPNGFDIEVYRYLNADLNNIDYTNLVGHYLNHGRYENRIYILPKYFDIYYYKTKYKLDNYTSGEILWNWISYGIHQKYKYNELVPDEFDQNVYRTIYPDISHFNIYDMISHYIEFGRNEGRYYKMPDGFDFNYYRDANNMVNYNEQEIIWHWFNHGQNENREYCLNNYILDDAPDDTPDDALDDVPDNTSNN